MVRDCTGIQKRRFLPEENWVVEAIKDIISNGNKVSSSWINNKIRKDILNINCSVENGTWLCDKAIITQSWNNCLSKFMKCCNFNKNKHRKKQKLERSRVRYHRFRSYFYHMLCNNNCYSFDSNNPIYNYGSLHTHRR